MTPEEKIRKLQIALDECGHTLFHLLDCKNTILCVECRKMAEKAITLTGWSEEKNEAMEDFDGEGVDDSCNPHPDWST